MGKSGKFIKQKIFWETSVLQLSFDTKFIKLQQFLNLIGHVNFCLELPQYNRFEDENILVKWYVSYK